VETEFCSMAGKPQILKHTQGILKHRSWKLLGISSEFLGRAAGNTDNA
jgi:hypothetical protein